MAVIIATVAQGGGRYSPDPRVKVSTATEEQDEGHYSHSRQGRVGIVTEAHVKIGITTEAWVGVSVASH